MSGANPHRDVESWSDYEDRDGTDLAALPEAVRTIVEECRALSKDVSRSEELAEDGQVLPYPCRLYESVEGEDELLQLQWMRVDMSTMDSDGCWGQPADCNEEHNCGPDSGPMLPAVYRVDPGQLFPLTFVGLPPELLRVQQESSVSKQRIPEEAQEDDLCKLGRNLTEALSRQTSKSTEGLPPHLGMEVASLAGTDWSDCIERHVDLARCDPVAVAQMLSSCAPPNLNCLLNTILPPLLAEIASRNGAATCKRKHATTGDGREEAAIRSICRLTASVASKEGKDYVAFREKVSGSGLRELGPLGREAEVVLAEAFFWAGAG